MCGGICSGRGGDVAPWPCIFTIRTADLHCTLHKQCKGTESSCPLEVILCRLQSSAAKAQRGSAGRIRRLFRPIRVAGERFSRTPAAGRDGRGRTQFGCWVEKQRQTWLFAPNTGQTVVGNLGSAPEDVSGLLSACTGTPPCWTEGAKDPGNHRMNVLSGYHFPSSDRYRQPTVPAALHRQSHSLPASTESRNGSRLTPEWEPVPVQESTQMER